MPWARNTPLRRTGIRRAGAFKAPRLPETPTKRHPNPKGVDAGTVDLVVRRDGCRCVRCGRDLSGGVRGVDWSIHHRRGRDGMPDSHKAQNLVLVCGADNQTGCHGFIHQRASLSRPAGWWITRNGIHRDPLLIRVRVDAGTRWVYLTAAGTYSELPPAAEAA